VKSCSYSTSTTEANRFSRWWREYLNVTLHSLRPKKAHRPTSWINYIAFLAYAASDNRGYRRACFCEMHADGRMKIRFSIRREPPRFEIILRDLS
jgi:hypothetical protein